MPTVPTVEGPGVALNRAPDAYQSTPQGLGNAGAAQQRQLALAGQAATGFANAYRREQEEADQVRVDDAINRAKERQIDLTFNRETGFTNIKGVNALQREGGKPLADEYTGQFKDTLTEIQGGLGNDRQKRAFAMRSNDMLTGFNSQVLQYEGQQFHDYTLSVREGTIENRKREVGLYYNDPKKIDDALLSIQAAVTDMGRNLGGKSAEWIEARARKETSNALVIAANAALERNDVAYADGFIKKYADRMDADDLLRVRGAIDKQMDAGIALKTATDVVRAVQPRVQPTDMDRVINITMQTESGGRRYAADGKTLLTSSAGAKGEMQVMDPTMRDPGLPGLKGLPADATPDQRAQFGRDYMGALVKRYDGDLAKAWAAYNGGFGRVDQEVKDAAKRGEPGAWLSNMPKETRAYVAKNTAAYGQGGGKPEVATLQEVHEAVRAQIGANPGRLKIALDESTRQWDDMQKAIKQREETATAQAQQWLATNGGRYSLMPNSIRDAVPAKEVDNLLTFGQKVAKGEDRTEPEAYQMFSNPGYLKSLSDAQFLTLSTRLLSEADREYFARERGKEKAGTAATNKPDDLNSGAIKSALDQRLRELGQDPTPKDATDDAGRIGAVRGEVNRSILAAQRAVGKKFSDAEVEKHIDGMFSQTEKVSGWFSTSKQTLSMKAGDIPGGVADRLRVDFRRNGVDKPTDAQLLGAYFRALDAQRSKARGKVQQ